MILATFNETNQVPKGVTSVIGYRWTFQISWRTIGFDHQFRTDDGVWHNGGGYYIVTILPALRAWLEWGRRHGYYDGPHDSLALGPVRFCWSGGWCDKCWNGK